MTDSYEARRKKNIRRTLRGVEKMNAREFDNYFEGYAPDLSLEGVTLPQPLVGLDNAEKWLAQFADTFPDLHVGVELIFASYDGEYVCYRYTCTGTRTNGFLGLPPTDTPFSFPGATVVRFNDQDEIAVSASFWDNAYVLQQLGAIPESFAGKDAPVAGQTGQTGKTGKTGKAGLAAGAGEEVLAGHVDLEAKADGKTMRYEGAFEIVDAVSETSHRGPCRLTGMAENIAPFDLPRSALGDSRDARALGALPVTGFYRATLRFNDRDAVDVAGWNMETMLPRPDESVLMMTSSMGLVVGGRGVYRGATGVHTVASGGLLSQSAIAASQPLEFHDLMVFRIARAQAPGADRTSATARTPADPPAPATPRTAPAASAGPGKPAPSTPSTPSTPTAQPALPPGVDPETYKLKTVQHLLRRIANFSFFSMPNAAQPNVPIMAGGKLIGVEVHEKLHRFHVKVRLPRRGGKRLRVRNVVGQPAAQVHMTWRPIPDDFVAYPGVEIPPTPLDPTRSQRFMMHDGRFTFDDEDGSGFRGFGTGRTYPVIAGGKPQLRIGAVVDVLEGLGKIAGHQGLLLVNGHIKPPSELALNILLRLTDADEDFAVQGFLPELRAIRNPDPENLYLIFLGEPDPDDPVVINRGPGGRMLGAIGPQRMRLVDIRCDVGSLGIRSETSIGQIAGRMDATAWFDPFTGTPPYPFLTTDGVFTFVDRDGKTIGTVEADMTEGRALPTTMPGAPMPVFRVGGIAPFIRGTGCFRDAVGLFTVNSFISLVPNTISGLFVMHLSRPDPALIEAIR